MEKFKKSFQEINDLIENKINPILKQHRGFVILSGLEQETNTQVILEFHGFCAQCPFQFSSTLQLIQEILREETQELDLEVLNLQTL